MRIVYIRIELEPDNADDPVQAKHARLLEFRDGMWTADGPTLNRITLAMAEIWKLLRGGR